MLRREAHHTQQAIHGDFSQFDTELLPDQILQRFAFDWL